jgi:hypothetical protein
VKRSRRSFLNWSASSPFLLAILSAVVAGCAASALQLAPVGIEAAGVGLSAVTGKTHGFGDPGREDDEDKADYRERCDNLQETPPTVIELHLDKGEAEPRWRALQLSNGARSPLWSPAGSIEAEAAWHPVAILYTMHFVPPFAAPKPGKSLYLAYAPSEPFNENEQNQLTSLTIDFGTNSGTFDLNGRRYNYATVETLPCFPPPSVAMR